MPTAKLDRFLAENSYATPFLVVDLDVIAERYRRLAAAVPARIHYAVKANPAPAVLSLLVELGSAFDAPVPTRSTDA
jgi:ornithine decarboxylase